MHDPRRWSRLCADPRHYQIAVLAGLLLYGLTAPGLAIRWQLCLLGVNTALLTQYLCTRVWRLPQFDPRSALISALSLSLLLRTDAAAVMLLAAAGAIGSKFLIRCRGKHLFNPTNAAICLVLLLSDRAWVSPGQWGHTPLLLLLLACLGTVVLTRARRADVTLAFLGCHAGILFVRAWWLGDPWTLPWYSLHSGALLIFSFFMISDPKSTPDSRAGRVLFAAGVAGVGAYLSFCRYEPDALMYALAAAAPLVPLLDRWLPGRRYRWQAPSSGASEKHRIGAGRSGLRREATGERNRPEGCSGRCPLHFNTVKLKEDSA